MFRCEKCNTVSEPGKKQHLLVTQIYYVEHPFREDVYERKADLLLNKPAEFLPDIGGFGPQIAKELKVCDMCWVAHRDNPPEEISQGEVITKTSKRYIDAEAYLRGESI